MKMIIFLTIHMSIITSFTNVYANFVVIIC